MSRALRHTAVSLWLALALAGCTVPTPQPTVVQAKAVPVQVSPSAVLAWLNLLEKVAGRSTELVNEELTGITPPEAGPELFYFGLLNQYSQAYEGWIKARDAFRKLRMDDTLAPEQQQLAGILQEFNQQRINSYQRYLQLQGENAELQQQLGEAEQEKEQLRQKIQALTDLEAQISTRKEQ